MFEPEMHYIRFLFITASPPAWALPLRGYAHARIIVLSPGYNRISDYIAATRGGMPCLPVMVLSPAVGDFPSLNPCAFTIRYYYQPTTIH